MGPIDFLETSVKDYHSRLRNIPEGRRCHQHCGGSLKSQIICLFYTAYTYTYIYVNTHMYIWVCVYIYTYVYIYIHKLFYWTLEIDYYWKPFPVFVHMWLLYYLCALLSNIYGCICYWLYITSVFPLQLLSQSLCTPLVLIALKARFQLNLRTSVCQLKCYLISF